MKNLVVRFPLLVLLIAAVGSSPAWAVNRELVELQTQVQNLSTQLTQMQQSLDERMGLFRHLMDQNTDSINKVTAAITDIQTSLQKQQSESGTRVDQLSGQLQALNDSLDELKARLGKVTKQLEDMQATQQTLAAQASQQAAADQEQRKALQAIPPDVLYNNALRDYNGGNTDLARQEFGDYLKSYPNTDLAGNAYFYLAELDYRAGNYAQAVKGYDQVLESFPDGNKAASAELKKGFALIESGDKDGGVAALRHVVERFPRASESVQARDRLRKLGVSATGGARKSR